MQGVTLRTLCGCHKGVYSPSGSPCPRGGAAAPQRVSCWEYTNKEDELGKK